MGRIQDKNRTKLNRQRRVRNVIRGTGDRPRLSVLVSNTSIHAQIIDDSTGKTLAGAKSKLGEANIKGAEKFAKDFAAIAKKAKVKKVVLDRGAKRYHGKLKAFADALRKEGLEF